MALGAIGSACYRFVQFLIGAHKKQEKAVLRAALTIFKQIDESHVSYDWKSHEVDGFRGSLYNLLKSNERQIFDHKVVALNYRAGAISKNKEIKLSEELKTLALAWKSNHIFSLGDTLTSVDLRNLEHAERYEEFIALIKDPNNKELRNIFFKWVLRDHGSVRNFVLLPELYEKINECGLSPRLGKFKMKRQERILLDGQKREEDKIFKIEDNVASLAYVNENDEKQWVELCDEKHMLFNQEKAASVEHVFQQFFGKKNSIIGNFEVFEKGVHFWSTNKWEKLGVKIDLDQEEWWKQLPVFESYTLEEAQKIASNLDGRNWGIRVIGSCKSSKIEFADNHAYKVLLIPNENGGYNAYPIGTFAKKFPNGVLEKLAFLTNTVEGDLHYLDQNEYFNVRRREGTTFVMNTDQGREYMSLQRRKLRMSLDRTPFAGNEKEEFSKKFNARRLQEIKNYAAKLAITHELQIQEISDLIIAPEDENFYTNLIARLEEITFSEDAYLDGKIKRVLINKIKNDQEKYHRVMNEQIYAFNIAVYSCAWNVQEELEELFGKEAEGGQIPNLFRIRLIDTDPPSILKPVILIGKILPTLYIRAIGFLMGSWRRLKVTTEGRTLYRSMRINFARGEIYSPSVLNKNLREGVVPKEYVLQ